MFMVSTVKLILKHFIHFDAAMNRIIFLISFLEHSLQGYRNTTDFYVLIIILLAYQLIYQIK